MLLFLSIDKYWSSATPHYPYRALFYDEIFKTRVSEIQIEDDNLWMNSV